MAKESGPIRYVLSVPKSFREQAEEYWEMRADIEKYSDGYFNSQTGGYYLVERSNKKHDIAELEAAKIMADNGLAVILKDEAGEAVTVDGTIYSFTYEQKTPYYDDNQAKKEAKANEKRAKKGLPPLERIEVTVRNGTPENIVVALNHAREKEADYAVIYMREDRHTQKSVMDGISLYESDKRHTYRFKKILVLTKKGRIYVHSHDT